MPILIHIFQFHIHIVIVQSGHRSDTQGVTGTASSTASALRCAASLLSRSQCPAGALSSKAKRVTSDCNTRSTRIDSIFQVVAVARNALSPVACHVCDAAELYVSFSPASYHVACVEFSPVSNPRANPIHAVSNSAHECAGIVAHARHAALHCAVDPVAGSGWFLFGSGGAGGRSGCWCFCGWCLCCGRFCRWRSSCWGFCWCASGGFVCWFHRLWDGLLCWCSLGSYFCRDGLFGGRFGRHFGGALYEIVYASLVEVNLFETRYAKANKKHVGSMPFHDHIARNLGCGGV